MMHTSATFGLDIIRSAFIAGAAVRVLVLVLVPPEHEPFMARLHGIAFGPLVPVFFVTSGIAIDFQVVLGHGADPVPDGGVGARPAGLPVLPRSAGPRTTAQRPWSAHHRGRDTVVTEAGQLKVEGQSMVVAAGMLKILCFDPGRRAGAQGAGLHLTLTPRTIKPIRRPLVTSP
jgi:hypothetical protein